MLYCILFDFIVYSLGLVVYKICIVNVGGKNMNYDFVFFVKC